MSQTVQLEVFYPYPPDRVWQVLTDRRALAAWMMENDFEPRLGHRFRFYHQPLPGLTTSIQCEVVELDEPKRLVYTWRETATVKPSLVIWTLTPVTGGTHLRLKHHQYSDTATVTAANLAGSIVPGRSESTLFPIEGLARASGWPDADSARGAVGCFNGSGMATVLDVPNDLAVNWHYRMNQTLPKVLA